MSIHGKSTYAEIFMAIKCLLPRLEGLNFSLQQSKFLPQKLVKQKSKLKQL